MKFQLPPRRILVAVDLSAPSLAALAAARDLARASGASLTAVYVDEPRLPAPRYRYDALDARAARALAGGRKSFRARWTAAVAGTGARPRARARWVRGWPAERLSRLAKPSETDLLVLGTHGRKGPRRLLLGSVAEAVLRGARVPVLCVRTEGPAA